MEHPKYLQERIAKQPKWVQRYMAKLLADIEHCQASIVEVENRETGISFSQGVFEWRSLPRGVTIRFELTDSLMECHVFHEDTLIVRRIGKDGVGRMSIKPDSGNTAWIS